MDGAVKSAERAFQPISGHRALDLLATLRDRHGEPAECLRTPADLDRWLRLAALGVEEVATDADLAAAHGLRETIDRFVRALLGGTRPAAADVDELNRWAARPSLAPQLGPGLEQRRTGGVRAALALLAQEAIELVTGPERSLIRECEAAPKCSRLYVDRSRGRRRRWCRMEWCGSTAKMREYRRRRG
jgi:predicted RNA-binding Zn ribbon-like protein